MAIYTKDTELENVIEILKEEFPNKFLHGEFTIKEYPNEFKIIDCNGVNVIVWDSYIGDTKCINYCREKELKRLSISSKEVI